MKLTKTLKLILITSLGLFLVSCSSTGHKRHQIQENRPINKDLIERSALSEDWLIIKNHLLQINTHALSREDQAYALYWMGASNYHFGRLESAKRNWSKAEALSPSKGLLSMIHNGQKALGITPQHNSNFRLKAGTWVLQVGAFSLKKSAEDLARSLSWDGFDVHVTTQNLSNKILWVTWVGPSSARQAEVQREKLKRLGHKPILKSSEEFQ